MTAMNPACEACRGACCETLVLPRPPDDIGDWLALRGEAEIRKNRHLIRINVPCSMLQDGACSTYAHRPLICRRYAVGGVECLAAIKRQRPEPQANDIIVLAIKHRSTK